MCGTKMRIVLSLALGAFLLPTAGCKLKDRGDPGGYSYSETILGFDVGSSLFDWFGYGGGYDTYDTYDTYDEETYVVDESYVVDDSYYYDDPYYYDDGYYGEDDYYDDYPWKGKSPDREK